jgi:hypothetical protein
MSVVYEFNEVNDSNYTNIFYDYIDIKTFFWTIYAFLCTIIGKLISINSSIIDLCLYYSQYDSIYYILSYGFLIVMLLISTILFLKIKLI